MFWRVVLSLLTVAAWVGFAAAQAPAADDLDALQEKAIKAAVAKVAPCVVQIETSGGSEVIGRGPRGGSVRKGVGPTSGLIVAADGYVLSSSFNFANKPSDIFVAVPGHKERYVAKVVAKDASRMVTLLKINAAGLPVPQPTPKNEVRVGQTALALGRTFETMDGQPGVSVGIIGAVGRIWGRAIQTDAKVSPTNYGGPLVDLQGRVMGVLVPASPQAEDETAGVEWYDSGLGFAIPLEDLNRVLPRLKEGKDLQKGILGIVPKDPDIYGPEPVVGQVLSNSAAAKGGIKEGDVIVEVDGKPVVNQAQVMHALGTRYEGDTVTVKVRRDKEEVTLPNLTLGSRAAATAISWLGILPLRDDPELGVEVRYVYPKGPADAAGLKAGDRIMKVGGNQGQLRPFSGRDQLTALLSTAQAGQEMKLEVVRKEGMKTEVLTVKLGERPDAVPDDLPKEATKKKALEPRKQPGNQPPPPPMPGDKKEEKKKDPETGLLARTSAAGDHQYWLYVPKDYDPNVSYGLVVWLHPEGKGKKEDIKDFVDTWEDYCKDNHLILAAPKAESDTGWVAGEAEFVQEVAREVLANYTVDRRRVVAHGMGVGGELAFYLGFHARDLVRGVATTGAALTSQPKERVATSPLDFYVVAGGKDPLVKAVAETKARLVEMKHPVTHREIANMGHQYLDLKTLDELVRWIDSLDRM